MWASAAHLRRLLSLPGLFLPQVSPGVAPCAIVVARAGHSDMGGVSAMTVAVPVSVGHSRLPLVGHMNRLREERPFVLALVLVTTQQALELARDWSLPARLAEVEIGPVGDRIRCRVGEGVTDVMRLEAHGLQPVRAGAQQSAAVAGRVRSERLLTVTDQQILQWEVSLQANQAYVVRRGSRVCLSFGEHPLGACLSSLRGRPYGLTCLTTCAGSIVSRGSDILGGEGVALR